MNISPQFIIKNKEKWKGNACICNTKAYFRNFLTVKFRDCQGLLTMRKLISTLLDGIMQFHKQNQKQNSGSFYMAVLAQMYWIFQLACIKVYVRAVGNLYLMFTAQKTRTNRKGHTTQPTTTICVKCPILFVVILFLRSDLIFWWREGWYFTNHFLGEKKKKKKRNVSTLTHA